MARIEAGKVQLLTRTDLDWTVRFKPIAAILGKLPAKTAYLDGEVVVLDGSTTKRSLKPTICWTPQAPNRPCSQRSCRSRAQYEISAPQACSRRNLFSHHEWLR